VTVTEGRWPRISGKRFWCSARMLRTLTTNQPRIPRRADSTNAPSVPISRMSSTVRARLSRRSSFGIQHKQRTEPTQGHVQSVAGEQEVGSPRHVVPGRGGHREKTLPVLHHLETCRPCPPPRPRSECYLPALLAQMNLVVVGATTMKSAAERWKRSPSALVHSRPSRSRMALATNSASSGDSVDLPRGGLEPYQPGFNPIDVTNFTSGGC